MNLYIPQLNKLKKNRKGKLPVGVSKNQYKIPLNSYAIVASECGIIEPKHIESVRKSIMRKTKRLAKVRIKLFPNISVSSKPIEVRMGKGKGAIDHWIFKVKKGRTIFEIDHFDCLSIQEAFDYSRYKFPFKVKLHKGMY